MAAALSIYDLLNHIIDNIPWRDESQRVLAKESVEEFKKVNLFGQMAEIVTCSHERIEQNYRGSNRCIDCGLFV